MPARPLIALLSALTLCAGCERPDDAVLAPPPAALVEPCAGPQGVPLRALTEAEVVGLWRRDRAALTDCTQRHGGLAAWANTLTRGD